jgi:hypothetical protein
MEYESLTVDGLSIGGGGVLVIDKIQLLAENAMVGP